MEVFQEAVLSGTPAIQFSPLWQAINHKKELLVTVIIHNISEESFHFTDQTVIYSIGEKILAKHTFSLPFLIKANTSVPWTFIFPKEKFLSDQTPADGKLELAKSYDPDLGS
jgi:SLAP domain-containing protein